MFKETKGLEYTLEVLKVLHHNSGKLDSKRIFELMPKQSTDTSLSYLQKILPRLAKLGLITSSEAGYCLTQPLAEVTVAKVLELCDLPFDNSPIYGMCVELRKALATYRIVDFHDFR